MVKIFIDPGHGGTDNGASGNGLQEKNVTLKIALKLRDILNNEYTGHSIKMSRSTDKTVSLGERTNMANAWGADYLQSIHINSGGGQGFESFIYNGNYSGKERTEQLRSAIHQKVVAQTGFSNRGKKEANFHMLRESSMASSLTENGFIDHQGDANNLKKDAFLEKVARGHAKGLAQALGLKKGDSPGKKTYLEVLVDSLWTYHSADWDDRAEIVHKGDVYTVKRDKFPVGDGYMYQIKSGLYITANTNYVREYTR
ncbi:MAG TPA: N-acetylmuramoyl-L-alanine amidase [Virgibacillus sp.]|nr:N-acetylmuramoyl-L-alanine amidase [Virgibacillus sp.]